MITLSFTALTTLGEIAEIIEHQKLGSNVEIYVRIETIGGKPVAFLVREPRIPIVRGNVHAVR